MLLRLSLAPMDPAGLGMRGGFRLDVVAPRQRGGAPCRVSCSVMVAPAPKTQMKQLVTGYDLGWKKDFESAYRVHKCIGSGAFGTVHLATSEDTGLTVGLSLLSSYTKLPALFRCIMSCGSKRGSWVPSWVMISCR